MAIDTPARLAVFGAGPVGLEAALYARFLGYDVVVYERGQIAETVRQAKGSLMAQPFKHCRTTLGLAALQAQDEAYQAPDDEVPLPYDEWRERYLIPLAGTDLLSDHLRLHTNVLDVAMIPWEGGDDDERTAEEKFRVLATTASGPETVETFAGVLDCTGSDSTLHLLDIDSPYLHVLGSKASQKSSFLMTDAYDQIRSAFAILGDRATLDLYAGAVRLLR